MFRESVLAQDEMIDRIARTMVPVAMDVQTVLNPDSKESLFLRPKILPGKERAKINTAQAMGTWILSPGGEVLGRPFTGLEEMIPRTEEIVDRALEAFGPVPPRSVPVVETHPWRGKGVMPDGSVSLAEIVREKAPRDPTMKHPVVSSVTLTREEFAAFAPPEAVAGKSWTVPDAVARKLCRVTSPMCYQHAPQPDWVTQVGLQAKVRAVVDGVAQLDYQGRISTRYTSGEFKKISTGKTPTRAIISEQTLTFTGEGAYDLATGRLRSLLLVGSGTMTQNWRSPTPAEIQGVIEWVDAVPVVAGRRE